MGTGPVVVGIDDPVSAQAAVMQAAWEGERRGSAVRLVHGYLVPTPCLTPLAPLLDERALLLSAEDRLARLSRTVHASRPDLRLEVKVVRASGSEALIEESAGAELVVVGAPHQRGFPGSVMGSVPSRLVLQARCPVLVVRAGAAGPGPGPVLVGIDGSPADAKVLQFGFDEASAVEFRWWPLMRGPCPSSVA